MGTPGHREVKEIKAMQTGNAEARCRPGRHENISLSLAIEAVLTSLMQGRRADWGGKVPQAGLRFPILSAQHHPSGMALGASCATSFCYGQVLLSEKLR